MQQNHVSLSYSSDYLPPRSRNISDDLREKGGSSFPSAMRHVGFMLDEVRSHVAHESRLRLSFDEPFVVEGKNDPAVCLRRATALRTRLTCNGNTPLQRQSCHSRQKKFASHC